MGREARLEFWIAVKIAAGLLAADPRYGDSETRLDPFIRVLGAGEVRRMVDWIKRRHDRRSPQAPGA